MAGELICVAGLAGSSEGVGVGGLRGGVGAE